MGLQCTLQKFVRDKQILLPWHVQNVGVVSLLETELYIKEFLLEFDLWVKNLRWLQILNSCSLDVWEPISNFIPQLTGHVITSWCMLVKCPPPPPPPPPRIVFLATCPTWSRSIWCRSQSVVDFVKYYNISPVLICLTSLRDGFCTFRWNFHLYILNTIQYFVLEIKNNKRFIIC